MAETHVLPSRSSWKVSRYTHVINLQSGRGILYNSYTGAILYLLPKVLKKSELILNGLKDSLPEISELEKSETFKNLIYGGFIISNSEDEIARIKEKYDLSRKNAPFLLTLFPTFKCNMICDYCFIGKRDIEISPTIIKKIKSFAFKYLENNEVPSFSVDWLGGEPILKSDVIKSLSSYFLDLSDKKGLQFNSQVITNGSLLNTTTIKELLDSKVSRLQITLDGPKKIHDSRRRFNSSESSTFESIMKGLHLAVGKFIIKLRINVDSQNLDSIYPLLDCFHNEGWLKDDAKFYPYLGRLSPYNDACSNVQSSMATVEEFSETQFKWWKKLSELGFPVEFQPLYQFPEPRSYNCSAVGKNGFVIGPDGKIYKCGLNIGDYTKSIGNVLDMKILDDNDNLKVWKNYTPLDNSKCQFCSFLPTCLGGCPRNRIEDRRRDIEENCKYYKNLELQILSFHVQLGLKKSGSSNNTFF